MIGLCTATVGCNVNENKEARIRRLEAENDRNAAMIQQLEEQSTKLEERVSKLEGNSGAR